MAIARHELENLTFAQLLLRAIVELPKTDDPTAKQLVGHHEIFQYLMKTYGQHKKSTLIQMLDSFGVISDDGLSTSNTPQQNVTVKAAPQALKAAETTNQAPQSPKIPNNTQKSVESAPVPAAKIDPGAPKENVAWTTIQNLAFEVFHDGKWPRTADGGYICPFCLSIGNPDPFIGKTPKSMGPHCASHVKAGESRSAYDEIADKLKPFEGINVVTSSSQPDESPKNTETADEDLDSEEPVEGDGFEHRLLSKEEDPGDSNVELDQQVKEDIRFLEMAQRKHGAVVTSNLPSQAGSHQDRLLSEIQKQTEFIQNSLLKLETVIASLLIIVGAMPEKTKKELADKIASLPSGTGSDRSDLLSEILSREL